MQRLQGPRLKSIRHLIRSSDHRLKYSFLSRKSNRKVLINMGARFPPCMHAIPGITTITQPIWPCLNNTANPSTDGPQCTLSDICGFGGFHGQPPDQVHFPFDRAELTCSGFESSFLSFYMLDSSISFST